MPAPTLSPKPVAGTQPAAAALPPIPYTRAARKKSRLGGPVISSTLTANVQALAGINVQPGGWARRIRLTVTGVTTGNAAAVAFNNDGPFNVLQQISMLTPNGDALISVIDGFTLAMINKYGAHGTGRYDPVADPTYSAVTGAGANGGSFKFTLNIPAEIDGRDAFCAIQNMAANQSYLLQLSLNAIAGLYTTAPTTPPVVTIVPVLEYWSSPAPVNADGNPQSVAPVSAGSYSILQTQQPPIVPGSQQNIQFINVGNTIRYELFILRTAAGVRTEVDWPNATNFYVNTDPWFYKTKDQWRSQMAQEYDFTGGLAAVPTLNTLDNGVYILTDFMNDGASGSGNVDGSSNRNMYLNTLSNTGFNVEAVNWGATAASLLVVTNAIRVPSPQALYTPSLI